LITEPACSVAPGLSLMIFPEGTRSRDGVLKPFKTGAFQLALEERVPILPIIVSGTSDALPKHGFVLRGRHRIGLRVLPEIAYATFAELTIEELTARVHGLFVRETTEQPSARALAPAPASATGAGASST